MSRDASRVPYDDDYATCERTYADLRIYTGASDPDVVTERLKISPTLINKKGERRATGAGRTRTVPKNAWFLSSEQNVNSRDLRRHLDWLLARLAPAGEALRRLQQEQDVRMSVICIWWSAHGGGGPTLWPEQMKVMAELGLECGFEVAFFGNEDEE